MSKLVKAEIYRICHSGKNLVYFALMLILICFFPFSGQWENMNLPFAVNWRGFLDVIYMDFLAISMFVAILLCNQFQNRIYYYEIMNGENSNSIILSKVVVYIGYIGIFFIIPNLIIYTTLIARNGLGGYDNIIMSAVLLGIAMIRVIVRAVFLTMILRRLVPVLGILYMSFFVEQVMLFAIDKLVNISQGAWKIVINYFISQQIKGFYQPIEYAGDFIITVIISFVIEFVILYCWTLCSYKRKKFR